jgi:MoxR-like ATPase
MLKVKVDYPNRDEELRIVDRMASGRAVEGVKKVASPEQILEMRGVVQQVFADNKVRDYIVDLVRATRNPASSEISGLQGLIEVGASPRASINLMKAVKAHALLQGRNYVTPHDVKTLAPDVLRHRVVISYEAEAEGKSSDDIIRIVLETVLVP